MIKILSKDHLITLSTLAKNNKFFSPNKEDLTIRIKKICPDIFHYHRSSYTEWPFILEIKLAKKHIETNIFGFKDKFFNLDASIPVSNFIKKFADQRITRFITLLNILLQKRILGQN